MATDGQHIAPVGGPDLGMVFAALPVAALVVDPAGRVRHANAACEQLLVRSERTMLGQTLRDVITLPPGYEAAGQGFAMFDGEFQTGRGHRFRADFAAAGIGDFPGWRTITLHNAVAPRRFVAPAGGARAAIGAAAMLAHEVKNPLSGIRGAAQLLAGGAGVDAGLTQLITAEVDRIAALIDRMQDFTDTTPLTLAAHNVHPLIDHVRRLGEAGFAGDTLVEERFDPSLPPALLDRDAFVQVLLNLMRNAVEAGAGTVALTSAYRHGLAVSAAPGRDRLPLPIEVCVIDDGPGAPPDIADHLFEPFVSGKPEGRGLGLALVDKLVGQMGGVVQHARESDRTVFRILLARGGGMSASILVVDDDAAIRTVVAEALRRDGHRVRAVGTLADCDRALAADRPDVLVSDVVLPDGDGLTHLAALGAAAPPAIVMSARNTLTTAVRATEAGAFEYLPKPFDLADLSRAVTAALKRRDIAADPIDEADRALPLIGRSPAMQAVYRVIARVVATELTVLILGESGTGKELVARAIHDLGARAAAPFVALNMAAIPRDLIEAELFGHERGAFTGADRRMAGRFEQAAGGTLFLDEIGDMPREAQTRLLRVLQSGEFTPVGGTRPIQADVRVIAATNRDLTDAVAAGTFREDLFYRLNVVPIALPALRERRADVALLARHFLDRAAAEGLPSRRLSRGAIEALTAHDWPGNVRELENMMRRLAALGRDGVIDAAAIGGVLGRAAPVAGGDLATAVRARIGQLAADQPAIMNDGTLYDRIVAETVAPLIAVMLERHGGNQLRTARALGINRNTLRKRLATAGHGRGEPKLG